MQELLLHEKTLDLQKAVNICRAHELTSKQTKEMAGAHIDKVTSSRHKSVGETGGSQHSQDKREESSPDKRGRQDFVQTVTLLKTVTFVADLMSAKRQVAPNL